MDRTEAGLPLESIYICSASWMSKCVLKPNGSQPLTHMDMTYIWEAQTKLKRRNRLLYYYHCFISKLTYAYIANIIFTKW